MKTPSLLRSALLPSALVVAAACMAAAAFAAPPATAPAAPPAATPPAAAPKTDAPKAAAKTTEPWPLATCIVSGEKLDAKAVTVVYSDPADAANNGREMKFCCKDCAAKFKKDPQPWLKKANEAIIAEQGKSYPMTKCIVSDETLDADAKTVVIGNRVFKICCMKCQTPITKDFAKYSAKLDAAAKGTK